jgi:site-specific recombinase XerD
MGQKSWRGQIDYALQVIDQRWTSKHDAKRAHGHRPGQAVPGVFSDGYWNTVFDRAITLTHWITVHYPELRRFDQVDTGLITEYLAEKTATCAPSTVRTHLACLRKLQEGLFRRGWLTDNIVPAEWAVDPAKVHRGAYAFEEAEAITDQVGRRDRQYGQALRFIRSSGARIDEVFHLRSDKVFAHERRVELLGKGGKTRRIQVLDGGVLAELDRSRRFVYLERGNERIWKNGLEDSVRASANRLGIQRRGVHGFRGTAATDVRDTLIQAHLSQSRSSKTGPPGLKSGILAGICQPGTGGGDDPGGRP